MSQDIDEAAALLWEYHHMHQEERDSDLIFVLCSHDLRVADYAASLFLQNRAPWILFSGGMAHHGDMLETGWDRSEAEMFALRAIEAGVPEEKIILECRARNTGENVLFSEPILREKGIPFQRILALQKPYMERRAYATMRVHWPDRDIIISSPPISLKEYPNEDVSRDELYNIMTGDLQRIIDYPARGFQISQPVPDEVLEAYHTMLEAGFNRHLIH